MRYLLSGYALRVNAYVKDGKIVKIEGTKEHPRNHGKLCTKGAAGRQYIYREDRLKTPLKRVGERGEGKFEPVSWEEAYRTIRDKLFKVRDTYGADSVAFFSGYTNGTGSICTVLRIPLEASTMEPNAAPALRPVRWRGRRRWA